MNELIKLHDLHKSFFVRDVAIKAVDSITLTIKKGEILALTGPSGAGKSTLLHLIGLMDRPTSGEIFFNGENTAGMPENKRCSLRNQHIGFIFQFHHLLPEFTALENVILPGIIGGGKMERLLPVANKILREVGMSQRTDHLPSQLSGGEQQRVAVARALMNEPEILLADEPTGNLDHETGETITGMLTEIVRTRKMTLVLVTHNKELERFSDRTARLLDGKIVE
ncbi:MAG: ABC transporter ATP-binding protein [Elusimicrobiota bacterium]